MVGENILSEICYFREKFKNYKVGSIEGLDVFIDVEEGEMEGM